MKKTILKRILVLSIVFLMIISTPFSISENINNNPYAYALTTFSQDLESELLKQTIIPTLIAGGLVFSNTETVENTYRGVIEYFESLTENYKPDPDDPDGPNLGEIIKKILRGGTFVSVGYGLGKNIVEIPQMFWELVKSFVDDNYDVGETIGINTALTKFNHLESNRVDLVVPPGKTLNVYMRYFSTNGTEMNTFNNYENTTQSDKNHRIEAEYYSEMFPDNFKLYGVISGSYTRNKFDYLYYHITDSTENVLYTETNVIGVENVIDNSNYDWNNYYTDTKVIPIPIEMDSFGNPKIDENGYYLPSTDVDEWLDVQPTEIPNLDPTGTPIPDIPPFPDIENPDNDEQTGIMIYIGNILQLIVGQLSKITEGVKTIVSNTNQLVFNTPNPVFDPTTGQQIDPETGEPIEEVEPEPATGDGIIGDGIDTNIPTDFDWGDFKHFIDIFFIFIYFIVILILILLKFLQIVFTGLPGIAPNTDLFTAYPEILAGVDYVKNLKVGGLTITVHQAFEFVFLIFFYIFIIKQIRKLYNAMVFEESAIPINHSKDMKLDYYDGNGKINQYGYIPYQIAAPSQNLLPYVEEKQKGNLNYAAKHSSEYQNIKITDYTEG